MTNGLTELTKDRQFSVQQSQMRWTVCRLRLDKLEKKIVQKLPAEKTYGFNVLSKK